MRFGLVMVAVLLAGCGSSGGTSTNEASTSSSSTSTTATSSEATTTGSGGAPPGTSSTVGGTGGAGGSGGQGGGGSPGVGGASTSVTTTSSSSTATATTGAGGAPPECTGAPDGTSCTETCGCPPCGQQPPSVGCGYGLCIDQACVQFRTVRCKVAGTIYEGCNLSASSTHILWADGKCTGSGTDVAYCAPGTTCYVSTNGQLLTGLCE